MNRDELKALHELATEARGLAHKAYEMALKNSKADGDTEAAYQALLKTNRVRDRIYAAILAQIIEPTPEPTPTPAPEAKPEPQLYRVYYVTSGLRRRSRTVDVDTLAWIRSATHTGIRVTSFRRATEAEAKRGGFTGALNA